jgi:hypothetical protein
VAGKAEMDVVGEEDAEHEVEAATDPITINSLEEREKSLIIKAMMARDENDVVVVEEVDEEDEVGEIEDVGAGMEHLKTQVLRLIQSEVCLAATRELSKVNLQ